MDTHDGQRILYLLTEKARRRVDVIDLFQHARSNFVSVIGELIVSRPSTAVSPSYLANIDDVNGVLRDHIPRPMIEILCKGAPCQ